MRTIVDDLPAIASWAFALTPWVGGFFFLFFAILGWPLLLRTCLAFWRASKLAAGLGVLMLSWRSRRGAVLRQALAARLLLLAATPGRLLPMLLPSWRRALMGAAIAMLFLAWALLKPLTSINNVGGWAVLPLSPAYHGQGPCKEVQALILRSPPHSSVPLTLLSTPWSWSPPAPTSSHLVLNASIFERSLAHANSHLKLLDGFSGMTLASTLALAAESTPQFTLAQGAALQRLRPAPAIKLSPCEFDPGAFLFAARSVVIVPWSSQNAWLAYLNPFSGAFGQVDRAAAAGFEPRLELQEPTIQAAARSEAAAWTRRHQEDTPKQLWWAAGFVSLLFTLNAASSILKFCRGFSMASRERERALFEHARLEDELRSETLPPPVAPTRRL